MVRTAAVYDDGPISFRYPRGNGIGVDMPERGQALEIGKGRIVKEGTKVAILSFGTRLADSVAAAEELDTFGLSTTVADARFAKPLDTELIGRLARNHEVLITVEEGASGGFAQPGAAASGDPRPARPRPEDPAADHARPFPRPRRAGDDDPPGGTRPARASSTPSSVPSAPKPAASCRRNLLLDKGLRARYCLPFAAAGRMTCRWPPPKNNICRASGSTSSSATAVLLPVAPVRATRSCAATSRSTGRPSPSRASTCRPKARSRWTTRPPTMSRAPG